MNIEIASTTAMNHDDSHSHHKPHGHLHHHHLHGKSLGLAIIFNTVITVAQAVVGIAIGSLSLLSDALHNLSDVFSLIISYIANRLVRRQCTPEQTFGYKRAEIMAALINVISLLAVAYYLILEAFQRIESPVAIDSRWVILLAAIGMAVNGGSVLLLKKGAEENSSIKSAYLHLFTDMLSSLAVLIGGWVMLWYKLYWLDSVLSILIAVYLLYSSWGLLMRTLRVLMQFSPPHIDLHVLQDEVQRLAAVENIHHVHIWQLNDTDIHFEAHVDFAYDMLLSEATAVLEQINRLLADRFGIHHTLLQPEIGVNDSKRLIVDDHLVPCTPP